MNVSEFVKFDQSKREEWRKLLEESLHESLKQCSSETIEVEYKAPIFRLISGNDTLEEIKNFLTTKGWSYRVEKEEEFYKVFLLIKKSVQAYLNNSKISSVQWNGR